jgi:phosphoribosylanthranilate isomerase
MSKPLLKFCGVRTKEDLKLVASSQAEYIGFIFAESKRRVNPEHVSEWLKKVDISTKKVVAVFVNPTIDEVCATLEHVPLDVIQFHGNESIEEIRKVKEIFAGSVWKALHHHPNTPEEMSSYNEVVDGFVIDSRIKGQWGGTGVSFDWSAVPQYIKTSKLYGKHCFIAGGVNGSNIERLLTYEPEGIDLSSGIEEEEKKSKEKIREIEERVLHYDNISR